MRNVLQNIVQTDSAMNQRKFTHCVPSCIDTFIMFNPFEAAQGGGNDDRTLLGENQPHRPTTGALRYSDDTELYAAMILHCLL